TLSDVHPVNGPVSFSFPSKMVARPLSKANMGRGSAPDGKAPWWPFFQERHKTHPNYWVQGHMLNDNIGGPGHPWNLVPISNTLNSNMCTIVERFAKEAILNLGLTVEYIVNAHWEAGISHNLGVPSITHVEAMKQRYPSLNWGEQFAPTRL